MLLIKQDIGLMQDILVNQMQISCSGISVRYLKFLVGGAANIGDIPESAVVIPVSRTSDTNIYTGKQARYSILRGGWR